MPEFIIHFVIVRPQWLLGKALRGIPISAMMERFPISEKIMPTQNPVPTQNSPNHSLPNEKDYKAPHIPSRRGQWLTGLGVLGVIMLMGALGLGLALWTQSQRRARDLPNRFAATDRLVENVARGSDLVVWGKGDFPFGNDCLLNLLPESLDGQENHAEGGQVQRNGNNKIAISKEYDSGISGCRFLAIPQAFGIGKTGQWAVSRKFGEKHPNTGGWVRLAFQLESTNSGINPSGNNEVVLPGPGIPGIRLHQKEGFLEWNEAGGKFLAAMGTSIAPNLQTSQITNDYGGTLAPDFLELRLGRIPPDAPAWLAARGGIASRHAALILLGHFPDWTAKGVDFPSDSGVFGLWEEAGNLRAEWIFTEQSASDRWEKVLKSAQLGSQWKWIKQGRVISLQRKGSSLWNP